MNRRDFLGGVAAGAVAAGLPGVKATKQVRELPALGDYLIERNGKWLHPTTRGLHEVSLPHGAILIYHTSNFVQYAGFSTRPLLPSRVENTNRIVG